MTIETVKWRSAGSQDGMTVFNARQGQKRLPWQAVKNPCGGYILQEYDHAGNVGKSGHEVNPPIYTKRLVDASLIVWRHENARSEVSTNYGE